MRSLALLVAVALLAGCSLTGDDGGSDVGAQELGQLVLQPEDLGRAFLRFDEGRQGIAETSAEAVRLGRVEGWKARYRRTGAVPARGPLVVASLVDLFESSEGAGDHLESLRAERASPESGWQPVQDPELGDESYALTLVQGTGGRAVRSFFVAWRAGGLTGSVDANGFDRRFTLADVVSLAEKQASRMADAA
jgi:hypothetical protein